MNTRIAKVLFLSGLVGAGCGVAPSDGITDGANEIVSAERKTDFYGSSTSVLIADQFNNRVIEVDTQHRVLWSYGDGSSIAGPTSIVAPNDAERVGSYTLIAGTGAPAGTEPTCTDACNDNRVVLVNRQGRIVWQYGQAGVTGAGANQLSGPVCSVFLPNGHVLITDQGNQRVIEVDGRHNIVWQYGTTGMTGTADNFLNNPNSAELLANGNILIADENNNRVIEVSRHHHIVWSYGSPADTATLNGAAFASRIEETGTTLITDSNNNRIIEVDPSGKVVFTFVTNTRAGSNTTPLPTRAVRLANGHTLVSDQFNQQVIAVDHAGKIGFTQGQLNVAGKAFNQLNGPYDAKVIGDYTGLTPPYGWY